MEEVKQPEMAKEPEEVKDGTSNAEVGNAKPVFTEEQNKYIEDVILKKRLGEVVGKVTTEFEGKLKQAEIEKQKETERAKMSEQEKFEADRKDFMEKEARFNALEKLTDAGLSREFVDMVKANDATKVQENIEALRRYIGAEVEKGVKTTLSGAPKSVVSPQQATQKDPLAWGDKKTPKEVWRK